MVTLDALQREIAEIRARLTTEPPPEGEEAERLVDRLALLREQLGVVRRDLERGRVLSQEEVNRLVAAIAWERGS